MRPRFSMAKTIGHLPRNQSRHMSTPTSSAPVRTHSRRDLLKILGAGTAALSATTLLTACDDDDPITSNGDNNVTIDFSSDIGVLNYAYALEQLEAAFYAAVTDNSAFGTIFSSDEQSILRDLQAHEEIHRDFLAEALGANAIPGLTPNFDTINFADKASVLGTAQVFEDLGVAAYNGAGRYFSRTEAGRGLLAVAGKIVSVEARHASVISDLLVDNRIAGAGVIDANGLDRAFTPDQVLGASGAAPFIRNRVVAINVPAS